MFFLGIRSVSKMFAVGDMVVYGGEGVCRVERIAPPEIRGMDAEKLYYTLAPLGRTGHVMTPVDTGVLMRPIMKREEAEQLLSQMQTLPEDQTDCVGVRALKEHYQQIVSSYDCIKMAGLIKAVCRRRKWAITHGKKISQLDDRFFRRAWDQLIGELAAALERSFEDMEAAVRESYPEL